MTDETEYLAQLERDLYAAVLADSLDALGLRHQVMAAGLTRVAGREVVAGRAATMRAVDEVELVGDPYVQQIDATDALRPGDIVVASARTASGAAFWGELFSTAAIARGARGAIVDGFVRDVRLVDRLGFPLFAAGARPVDSMGRLTVHAHGVPIRCGGVEVAPGDLVFAEPDGVVVVPHAVEAEVVAAARAKVAREDGMRDEIRSGTLLADAWQRHRVL
jgi:regulator of RNase E activity RraA